MLSTLKTFVIIDLVAFSVLYVISPEPYAPVVFRDKIEYSATTWNRAIAQARGQNITCSKGLILVAAFSQFSFIYNKRLLVVV